MARRRMADLVADAADVDEPTPAPVAPEPVTAAPAGARQDKPSRPVARASAAEPARPAKKTKMSYYAPVDFGDRLRAFYYAARDDRGWSNTTDMHLDIMGAALEAAEARYNAGDPFEPRPAGTGPVGRPLR